MNALALPSKVMRLIPLLGSNRDGEVLGTVRAIERTLKAAGKDWHDLARAIEMPVVSAPSVAVNWHENLRLCAGRIHSLSEREQDFISRLVTSTRWGSPTERQEKWLSDIAARLRRRAA